MKTINIYRILMIVCALVIVAQWATVYKIHVDYLQLSKKYQDNLDALMVSQSKTIISPELIRESAHFGWRMHSYGKDLDYVDSKIEDTVKFYHDTNRMMEDFVGGGDEG